MSAVAVSLLSSGSGGIDALGVAELAIAVLLVLLGIRSLVRWLRKGFRPANTRESVLYALHVTARVGMWFAFAGFFAGYALIDEPQTFRLVRAGAPGAGGDPVAHGAGARRVPAPTLRCLNGRPGRTRWVRSGRDP